MHDALDYHQLKVSIFSEDKRTDLIGECWIPLDSILTPGGGKNDIWQTLNYKGRYAGEIRVELTFYDSRPREAKMEDAINTREKETTKPVKRRPLPADPTSGGTPSPVSWHGPRPLPSIAPQASPAPSIRSQEVPQTYREPEQHQQITQPSPSRNEPEHHTRSHSDFDNGQRLDMSYGLPPEQMYSGRQPVSVEDHEEPDYNYNGSAVSAPATFGGIELPELPPHTPRSHRSGNVMTPKYYSPANSSPAYTLPQYETPSEGQLPTARERAGSNNAYENDVYNTRPIRTHSVDDSLQHYHHHNHHHQQVQHPEQPHRHHSEGEQPRYNDQHDNNIAAPPPPRHVKSSSNPKDQFGYPQPQPSYAPAPLNVRRPGPNNATSPLYQEYNPQDRQYETLFTESHSPMSLAVSAPVSTNHTPVTQRFSQQIEQRGPVDAIRYDGYNNPSTPPSRFLPSSNLSNQGAPYSHDSNQQIDHYRQGHYVSNSMDNGQGVAPVYDQTATWQPDQGASPQQYAHREGAPIARPRAVSPGAKATTRKSVSPRPSIASDEPSLRGVAFSPDSFDQFNPSMGGSNPGSQSATPENSRGASRSQDFGSKIETGPIIGSDGRVIDPSDHLPSDTWAPEPEKKSPRKSHQINVKFRHIPQATQQRLPTTTPSRALPQITARPMPTVAPPQQATVQQYPTSNDSTTYNPSHGDTRNRLQKRQPQHLQSSPTTPSPQHYRTPPSQPLRENPNYGYSNTSPSYGRQSISGPPPVPAKIPHSTQQEDWQQQPQPYYHAPQQYQQQYQAPVTSLSEEMSRIDIGSGSNGRIRRPPIRYGTQ